MKKKKKDIPKKPKKTVDIIEKKIEKVALDQQLFKELKLKIIEKKNERLGLYEYTFSNIPKDRIIKDDLSKLVLYLNCYGRLDIGKIKKINKEKKYVYLISENGYNDECVEFDSLLLLKETDKLYKKKIKLTKFS